MEKKIKVKKTLLRIFIVISTLFFLVVSFLFFYTLANWNDDMVFTFKDSENAVLYADYKGNKYVRVKDLASELVAVCQEHENEALVTKLKKEFPDLYNIVWKTPDVPDAPEVEKDENNYYYYAPEKKKQIYAVDKYSLPSVIMSSTYIYYDGWAVDVSSLTHLEYVRTDIFNVGLHNGAIKRELNLTAEYYDFYEEDVEYSAIITDEKAVDDFAYELKHGTDAGKVIAESVGADCRNLFVWVDYVDYPICQLVGRIDETGKFIEIKEQYEPEETRTE